jgi:DNA polymerase-1
VYGVPLDEVTLEMRSKSKMVNYGIAYGMSSFGLAQRLRIARKEAGEIIARYFTQYPKIRGYMDEAIAFAHACEYVQTLKGRRRFLRDINSRNRTARAAAERIAINAPIQGTAADMIKIAMIDIARELAARGLRTQMILQVHDELVFDLHRDEREEVVPLVHDLMRDALPLAAPIEVELGVGEDWLSAH